METTYTGTMLADLLTVVTTTETKVTRNRFQPETDAERADRLEKQRQSDARAYTRGRR